LNPKWEIYGPAERERRLDEFEDRERKDLGGWDVTISPRQLGAQTHVRVGKPSFATVGAEDQEVLERPLLASSVPEMHTSSQNPPAAYPATTSLK
jgi:hypothetical protein